jgi:hypothetical protein
MGILSQNSIEIFGASIFMLLFVLMVKSRD